ncbi:hypothetical protein ACFFNY_23805 [Paenibacillus hodogayensis]|uniref:Uncharacterized protein n=1 Tax=Paenibacillus hodogayensis TaxID=279208 RepID=A0ABV5W207_9BACL
MSNLQNQFKKWKHAATQLIANENDGSPSDESPVVELEPEYYERCRQLAEARNTTVSGVVHYMLKQQFALRGQERIVKPDPALLESNPLLSLDGLTGRRRSWEEEVEEDEYA